jgi:hypothetical protein
VLLVLQATTLVAKNSIKQIDLKKGKFMGMLCIKKPQHL